MSFFIASLQLLGPIGLATFAFYSWKKPPLRVGSSRFRHGHWECWAECWVALCIWFAWLLPCSVQEQMRPVVCLCVAWTTWIIVVAAKAQDACWGWCTVFLWGLLVPCSPRFSRLAAEDRVDTDSFPGSFAWLGASSCNFLINNQPLCPFILNLCPCLTFFTIASMGSPGGRQEHRGLWDLLRDSVLTWHTWQMKLHQVIVTTFSYQKASHFGATSSIDPYCVDCIDALIAIVSWCWLPFLVPFQLRHLSAWHLFFFIECLRICQCVAPIPPSTQSTTVMKECRWLATRICVACNNSWPRNRPVLCHVIWMRWEPWDLEWPWPWSRGEIAVQNAT